MSRCLRLGRVRNTREWLWRLSCCRRRVGETAVERLRWRSRGRRVGDASLELKREQQGRVVLKREAPTHIASSNFRKNGVAGAQS